MTPHALLTRLAVACSIVAAAPAFAAAQHAPIAPAQVAPTVRLPAPVAVATAALARTAAEPNNLLHRRASRDVEWMIIGGAMLVVGSIVDGDVGTIVIVGGAVIGFTGLWRYLQ